MIPALNDIISLGEGALVALTENIKNPDVDRRMKYDWRRFEVLPKGTKFRVEHVRAEEMFRFRDTGEEEREMILRAYQNKGCPVVEGATIIGVLLSPLSIPGHSKPGHHELQVLHTVREAFKDEPRIHLGREVIQNLESADPKNLRELLDLHHTTHRSVLDKLLDKGVISMDDIKGVL